MSKSILMLKGKSGSIDDHWLALLKPHFNVTILDTSEHIHASFNPDDFGAILISPDGFLKLQKNSNHKQAVDILNNIDEGVCIANQDGMVLWANRKMDDFFDLVKDAVSERSQKAFGYFTRKFKTHPSSGPPVGKNGLFDDKNLRPRKYSYTDEETNRYFEIIITPMFDAEGHFIQVATVVREATSSRRLQQRIDAIDKAGSELVRLEAENFNTLTVEKRIQLLQDKIIRYATRLLHFDRFVVRLLHRKTNQLEVLFGVDLPGDMDAEVFVGIENNGITGYVAATGRSYICNDPSSDPHYIPGMDGACSTLTVPLRLHDKIIGTINVESQKRSAFSEEDRQMAEIFGRYIAIAVNILDLMVVERHHTTGQAANDLNRQISDPLSNIINDVSTLLEDYIGHDDIRHRLQAVISNADSIKNAMKDVKEGPKGICDIRSHGAVNVKPGFVDKRLLIVDDEEFIRQTIADVVRDYGCIADIARDGREAISLIGQKRYDLVISDIKMPYATGYEVFLATRKMDESIPVILMTAFGYDPDHSIVRANREGLNAVLSKPFKVDQLIHEIQKALKVE
ncbi:MAG: response regulator [Phycisphaerae bacterium]|nr:response regulator [Phycisphaerae bacterium]